MKKAEEVMEILEAYDLTGSFRQAAALVGCDHKTVAHWVAVREQTGGAPPVRARHRRPMADPVAVKIEELVDRSRGQIRADQAHRKLVAMGYERSERTTRRAVAEAKRRWRQRHGRRTRPWIPEPGLWVQWDYGEGPLVAGSRTVLFCALLAWSRYRVVVPLRDKTLPSVVIGLDRTLRRLDGVPTYALTDNEKTVTVEHVCGIAVRNPQIVEVSRHYGLTVATCEPADRQSKGGSESTVKIAKADLVPTDHNLRDEYVDFAELEQACEQFMAEVNTRPHRVTRRPPIEMLARGARASAPAATGAAHALLRADAEGQLAVADLGGRRAVLGAAHVDRRARVGADRRIRNSIVVHVDGPAGPREVARHQLTTPGRPAICDEHYPPRPAGALERKPRARSGEEREFLALGDGAEAWLIKAAAAGATTSAAQDGRGGRPRQAPRHRRGRTERCGRARTPAGSLTVTSPRSSPTSSRPES